MATIIFYGILSLGNCSDIPNVGQAYGIANMDLIPSQPKIPTLCKFDNYTWTVIQQRVNGDVLFNRTWAEYKEGFGEISNHTDFWYIPVPFLKNVHVNVRKGA